ncbi:uncharacterized protein LY89DRAFT_590938 [Mollisia scopiformis]|uniref:Xylanolytic transcriptional activator regulatory domain-containing protein n=1 Tax=Mollisia scopiformis TaxID=149040 RepID=A0A194X135_MOLSC|nr:uncharacterized protein LY89DRAFT_590938 [Mollisia scopiformis]KUJ13906.1 hypothetical protein LY89DRAFT_590938 [Mollisia scopiformis]
MPHLLPRQSDISWKPHEVEYLRHQGVFVTPPDDICDDLIRCYFHHVHFFLPVIDAASFLTEYDNNNRQNISLLLFWSMLLAAANFVEADVLQKAGFASRKAMKTTFYERAKALYDLDHGTDKLVLIQSCILMSLWYTDPQDHTGAWYWIGIAISLSQTLGLHRCPQFNNRSQRLPETQQPMIRRIWWSCIVRDRWISLAKGRPMRIHHEDCDIPEPEAEDIMKNLASITAITRRKFVPSESDILAQMWINLVKISDSLGRILRIHYRATGPKALADDVDRSMGDLQSCRPRLILTDDASDLLLLHAYHLELFYEATVAVLYRPYVLSTPSTPASEKPTSWQRAALEQARTAASNTNTVLEKIIELNTVHLLKPMIITTIIPAMQIHLFDCKSSVPLRRGLGKNKLSLCMLVLSQLRDTYWSASVIFRLFERAQTMLDKSKSNNIPLVENPATNHHRSESHSTSSPHVDTEYQQHQQFQQASAQASMGHIPDSNLLTAEQTIPDTYWFNDSGSPCFSNVDQLLSPGFSVPENVYQPFFTGYDNGIGGPYNHLHPPNGNPVNLMYNV